MDQRAARRKVGPRIRQAARLYGSGLMTKGQAARTMGLHWSALSVVNRNPIVMREIAEAEARIAAGTVDMSAVIKQFGRLGLVHIAQTMSDTDVKADVRLKAAMDLADRSPETAKTNRISLEGDVTLRQEDAAGLMKALAEASDAAAKFRKDVSEGDYVKIDQGSAAIEMPKLIEAQSALDRKAPDAP